MSSPFFSDRSCVFQVLHKISSSTVYLQSRTWFGSKCRNYVTLRHQLTCTDLLIFLPGLARNTIETSGLMFRDHIDLVCRHSLTIERQVVPIYKQHFCPTK